MLPPCTTSLLLLPLALLPLSSASAPYPDYCSHKSGSEFWDQPRVPPLSSSTVASLSPTLLSASAVIRHGARTPWGGGFFCWDGYRQDASQSVFDCDTSMVMTTAPTSASSYTGTSNLLFKKNYAGLADPERNELGGTCHLGQLIEQGVEQETRNGEQLRAAYVCGDVEYDADDSRCLFRDSDAFLAGEGGGGGIDRTEVYFRGDDQQRTLMSGQILTEALFPTTEELSGSENVLVDWMTGDYSRDPIYPNNKICPRMTELQTNARASEDYLAYINSPEIVELTAILTEDLGGADWTHALDCQMTAVCNDRPIPAAIDDFQSDDDNSIFNRITAHASWLHFAVYDYQDAEYAKIAMAPLLGNILKRSLLPSLTAATKADMKAQAAPLLALYSGHDTTVMPMLSALEMSAGDWAPYASLVTIETYYVADDYGTSGRAFRVV
ncbi:hypothetical protein TeGR_g4455, partial [Tetraparma gracilis]